MLAVAAFAAAQQAEPARRPIDETPVPQAEAEPDNRAPALIIELPPPEPSKPTSEPPAVTPQPDKVGIHRPVPEAWQGQDIGPALAQGPVDVISRGAQDIRVLLTVTLPPGSNVVFSQPGGPAVHTVEADELSGPDARFWSPVIEGEALRVTLAGASSGAVVIIERIAHGNAGNDLPQPHATDCTSHIDAVCREDDLPDNQLDAIAYVRFERSEGSYACSGALLNDQTGSFEPYVLTARHCIDSSAVAETLSVRWFYRHKYCGGRTFDERSTWTHGGGDLLADSASDDMVLVLLRDDPPRGVLHSGWSISEVGRDVAIHVLSHPNYSDTKYTAGRTGSQQPTKVKGLPVKVNTVAINITEGALEGGSSGGGVFDGQYLIGVNSAGHGCQETHFAGLFRNFYPHIERHLDPARFGHVLSLFFPLVDLSSLSLAHIASFSDEPGTVTIDAWDDNGDHYGPIEFDLEPFEAVNVNSLDLEMGNTKKGLSGGVGDGAGAWRLAFSSNQTIRVRGYVRRWGHFWTPMTHTAPERLLDDGRRRYHLPVFKPAPPSDTSPLARSFLRAVNPSAVSLATVTIKAWDADGNAAPGGELEFELGGGEAVFFNAFDLEDGADGLIGALGHGTGHWRLWLYSDVAIEVMSYMLNASGYFSNMSQ